MRWKLVHCPGIWQVKEMAHARPKDGTGIGKRCDMLVFLATATPFTFVATRL